MLGELVTRVLVLLVGYAYPAYECFKTLEQSRVEVEQLYFWCQYWTIVGAVTVLENFDAYFVSWLPMYNESKLAFFIYLWSPKTKGATFVYESLLRPYVLKHQPEIEKKVQYVAAKSGDLLMFYMKNIAAKSHSACRDAIDSITDSRSRSIPPNEVEKQPPPEVPWYPPSAPPYRPEMYDAAVRDELYYHGGGAAVRTAEPHPLTRGGLWPRRRRHH